MVDAYIKADELKTNHSPLYGWLQARVVSVDGEKLYLEFEKSSNMYDASFDRWSTEIAPFESKTKEDYEWRASTFV
jgi:hypothetical protein